MLMQNFGVTKKEPYGMLWYFWSACFLLGKFPFETVKVMLRLLRFSKCDWLRNPSLFSTSHNVGVLVFRALGSGYVFFWCEF